MDLYILPLTGFDVVLGVTWLQSLDPILWDFKVMKMSFKPGQQQVNLQGVQNSSMVNKRQIHVMTVPKDTIDELQELLQQYDALFQEP